MNNLDETILGTFLKNISIPHIINKIILLDANVFSNDKNSYSLFSLIKKSIGEKKNANVICFEAQNIGISENFILTCLSNDINYETLDSLIVIKNNNWIKSEFIKMYENCKSEINLNIDPKPFISKFNTNLINLVVSGTSSNDITINSIIQEYNQKKDGNAKVFTYFSSIDKVLKLDVGLFILAARPGMGKTALVCSIISRMCENGINVGFFSLEMTKFQIIDRLISSKASIDSEIVKDVNKHNPILKDSIDRAKKEISNWNLILDDSSIVTPNDIKYTILSNEVKNGKIDVIFVDYLQLMRSDEKTENRVQQISSISMGLKALSKQLNVPVIALSQLSRAVETREDKKPILSDLRESGSIEQDADAVMFLYRPEYYGITENELGQSLLGVANVIVAKNRNGNTSEIQIKSELKYTRFDDYE